MMVYDQNNNIPAAPEPIIMKTGWTFVLKRRIKDDAGYYDALYFKQVDPTYRDVPAVREDAGGRGGKDAAVAANLICGKKYYAGYYGTQSVKCVFHIFAVTYFAE